MGGLAPSSHEATLAGYLAKGYPTGALLPLGVGARLVDTDPAWVFQPYLAFLAAMLALCLYGLAGHVVQSSPWRAFVAALASQSALLYGFALWGGVKELYAAAALALVAATVPLVERSARSGLLPGAAAAATVLALSPGALVWLLPMLVALLAAARAKPRGVALACVAGAVLALPAFVSAGQFLRAGNRSVLRDAAELGNLIGPLDPAQLLGIWPTVDFRIDPSDAGTTLLVLGVALAAASIGLHVVLARRASALLAYSASCVLGAVAYSALGSPWVEAKAFAVASPGVLLLALVGGTKLLEGRRTVAVLVLATIAGGVFASNALAYRDARLAPHAQLAELEEIGHRFAGAGPALMTEYQPYGVRHFLRHLDAEGASELRRRPVPLRDGRLLGKGESAAIDAFAPEAVLVYRTLVLLRGADTAARRPSTGSYGAATSTTSGSDRSARGNGPRRRVPLVVAMQRSPGGTAPVSPSPPKRRSTNARTVKGRPREAVGRRDRPGRRVSRAIHVHAHVQGTSPPPTVHSRPRRHAAGRDRPAVDVHADSPSKVISARRYCAPGTVL